MTVETIFRIHLIFGYVVWGLCFITYIWPWLRNMKTVDAQRIIATLHSFRFIGLVFLVPGVVSPEMPGSFANFAAYWDFATGVLAILALLTFRIRLLFTLFVVAFNTVGAIDFLVDYYHAIQSGLPAQAGQFASAYYIPALFVPLLMITHIAAFYLLFRARTHERLPEPRMTVSE